jgi:hypothetical protein
VVLRSAFGAVAVMYCSSLRSWVRFCKDRNYSNVSDTIGDLNDFFKTLKPSSAWLACVTCSLSTKQEHCTPAVEESTWWKTPLYHALRQPKK